MTLFFATDNRYSEIHDFTERIVHFSTSYKKFTISQHKIILRRKI